MSNRECHYEKCICRRRVLIVDNDPGFRADHQKNLADWGYEVYTAKGRGKTLIEDAKQKAREHRCHVALVDMRLYNDDDENDHSGLSLVPKLKPTRSVVVTAYGDLQTARLALTEQGACDIVDKEWPRYRLHNAIQKAIDTMCANSIEIGWPSGWSTERVAEQLSDEKRHKTIGPDEANDIIAQLFPSAKRVVLERLDREASTPTPPISATRLHSILFLATADTRAPVILKLMHAERTEQEKSNYYQYVDGFLGVNRYAQLRSSIALWELGGAVYSFVGNTDESFGEIAQTFTGLYDSHTSVSGILAPLEKFFGVVWHPHYEKPTELTQSLFEDYDRAWRGNLSEQFEQWRTLPTMHSMTLLNLSDLPNPLRWVVDHTAASNLPRAKQSVVHGDFHGDNLLVDTTRYPWIIDFERTGLGHVLRDFVEITQDILIRLAILPTDDLTLLYEMAVCLADPKQPDMNMVRTRNIAHNNEASKAFSMINEIRRIAYDQTRYVDSREYLWGVLLDMLFVMTVLDEEDPRQQKLLLLSSITCYRLDHWADPVWPPANWPPILWVSDHEAQQMKSHEE